MSDCGGGKADARPRDFLVDLRAFGRGVPLPLAEKAHVCRRCRDFTFLAENRVDPKEQPKFVFDGNFKWINGHRSLPAVTDSGLWNKFDGILENFC